MNDKVMHDVLIIILGGIFGVCLGRLPSWTFYIVLGLAVLLAIIIIG